MAGPDDVPTLDVHLGYWLRIVSNAVSQAFARKVEGRGVTVAEWVVLRLLHDVDSLSPSLLATRMGMTRGAVSKLADRLVEKGLVERRANPQDKRAHSLALLPEGRRLVPELAQLADANDAAFFDVLEPEQQEALRGLLKTIVARRGLFATPTD